jgi:hypothetical protein
MLTRHVRILDSFVRVGVFMDEHPTTGPLSYGTNRAILQEAIDRVRAHAGKQETAHLLSTGELRRQEKMIAAIRRHHMRPIVATARGQIDVDPGSAERPAVAFRLPRGRPRATRMIEASDAMLLGAKRFEATFIAEGLPPNFIARFQAARDELVAALGDRNEQLQTRAGATEGIFVEMRRARRVVDRVDAIVNAAFADDEPVLEKWRVAKRAHRKPGGTGKSAAGGRVPRAGRGKDGAPPRMKR